MTANRQDIHHSVQGANAFSAASIGTDTTTAGATVDKGDFLGLEFFVKVDAFTDGDYAITVQESDDASAWSAPDSEVILGSGSILAADSPSAGDVYRLGYVGKKRYARLSIVSTSTTTGATLSGIAVKANPRDEPVADSLS